jgi:dihydrofolate reductase
MDVVIHAAVAANGVIGAYGGLPWRLSSDLKRFKDGTMGRPIVMGRKTFDSIGRVLPGRLSIVVTRDAAWRHDGVETVGSLEDAITLATVRGRCMAGADEVAIIGGGQIYAQAMALADRLHITHVLASVEGDTRFPEIDPAAWVETHREDVPAGERDSHATRFCIYRRR